MLLFICHRIDFPIDCSPKGERGIYWHLWKLREGSSLADWIPNISVSNANPISTHANKMLEENNTEWNSKISL